MLETGSRYIDWLFGPFLEKVIKLSISLSLDPTCYRPYMLTQDNGVYLLLTDINRPNINYPYHIRLHNGLGEHPSYKHRHPVFSRSKGFVNTILELNVIREEIFCGWSWLCRIGSYFNRYTRMNSAPDPG